MTPSTRMVSAPCTAVAGIAVDYKEHERIVTALQQQIADLKAERDALKEERDDLKRLKKAAERDTLRVAEIMQADKDRMEDQNKILSNEVQRLQQELDFGTDAVGFSKFETKIKVAQIEDEMGRIIDDVHNRPVVPLCIEY